MGTKKIKKTTTLFSNKDTCGHVVRVSNKTFDIKEADCTGRIQMQETITIVVQQSGQGPKRQNFVHEQQQVRGDVPHRRGVPQPRHMEGQRTKNSKQRPLPLAA